MLCTCLHFTFHTASTLCVGCFREPGLARRGAPFQRFIFPFTKSNESSNNFFSMLLLDPSALLAFRVHVYHWGNLFSLLLFSLLDRPRTRNIILPTVQS